MSRIAHLITEEEGEYVWTAGGPYGAITLHLLGSTPLSIVAHSPCEVAGWDSTGSGCIRLEGLPCWYLRDLNGWELACVLLPGGVTDERTAWHALDTSYRLFLEGRR